MDIKGKTVLITGAAARIGAHLAEGFAARGANLALHYLHSEALAQETAERCKKIGVHVSLFKADLSQEDQVANLIKELHAQLPSIDVLVNNASMYHVTELKETTWQDLMKNQSIHCFSAMMLSQWFYSKQPPQGMILNFLDAGLHRFDEQHVPYQLSKRSLADLTHMMAMEYAPTIRVNAIAPGPMLPAASHSMAWFEQVVKELPLPRAGTLDEILSSALFLLESDYITGQIIYCDGGYHLKGRDLR